MHNFISDYSFEGIKNLNEKLDGLFFRDGFIFLEVLLKITLIAKLEYQIEIIGSFFDII
jgi:hypothetical protein